MIPVAPVLLDFLIYGAIGAVIAVLCRGHSTLLWVATLLASLALYITMMLHVGLLGLGWTLVEYAELSVYQFIPFLAFALLPCVLGVVIARCWRKNRSRQ